MEQMSLTSYKQSDHSTSSYNNIGRTRSISSTVQCAGIAVREYWVDDILDIYSEIILHPPPSPFTHPYLDLTCMQCEYCSYYAALQLIVLIYRHKKIKHSNC